MISSFDFHLTEEDLLQVAGGGSHIKEKMESAEGTRSNKQSLAKQPTGSVPSESEKEAEIPCPVINHEGRQMLDIILPFSVDHVYTLLFTDSAWFQDFLVSRNTKDFVPCEWQYCAETGEKLRQLSYTVALNLAIAKSARSTESQKIVVSKEGEVYVIETDVANQGVPYSESFSIKSHNCITRVAKNKCRYRVFSQINYKKSVWGLVKTVIEKNAMQGAVDFCTDLEKALKVLAGGVQNGQQQQTEAPQPERFIRLNQESNPPVLSIESPPEARWSQTPPKKAPAESPPMTESFPQQSSMELFVKAMLLLLFLLFLLNVLLVMKLGSLEDLSVKLNSFPEKLLGDVPAESIPALSRGEFLRVLRKQEILHRTEISKWQEALGDMLKLFQAIEASLIDLKTAIDSYSGSAAINSITSNSLEDSKHLFSSINKQE